MILKLMSQVDLVCRSGKELGEAVVAVLSFS